MLITIINAIQRQREIAELRGFYILVIQSIQRSTSVYVFYMLYVAFQRKVPKINPGWQKKMLAFIHVCRGAAVSKWDVCPQKLELWNNFMNLIHSFFACGSKLNSNLSEMGLLANLPKKWESFSSLNVGEKWHLMRKTVTFILPLTLKPLILELTGFQSSKSLRWICFNLMWSCRWKWKSSFLKL